MIIDIAPQHSLQRTQTSFDAKILDKQTSAFKPRCTQGLFDFASFASVYIASALELASEREKGFEVDYFYDQLPARVNERTGIQRALIDTLHRPFHWEFFNNSYATPLVQKDSECLGEKTRIIYDASWFMKHTIDRNTFADQMSVFMYWKYQDYFNALVDKHT